MSAEGLQLPMPEQLGIASMGLHMIGCVGCCDTRISKTEHAQGVGL
jgi:hypothetical protein